MAQYSKAIILTCISAAVLSACASIAVPPPPVKTESAKIVEAGSMPAQFFNAQGVSLPLTSKWWTGFEDTEMTALIETALSENRQLDIAQSNIAIAQAVLERQSLETSYRTASRSGIDIGRAPAPNRDVTASLSGGLGASWEYDAFGRIASAIKAAELGVDAAEQARRDIAVIVSSETALAYIDLRGAQRRLQVARENADTQSQSLDLLNELLENGRATALDVSRADAQYRTTLSELPRFQGTIDNAAARLAVLTGSSAASPSPAISALEQNVRPIPALKSSFAIGTPAELLRRRPDIRAAETDIARLLALSEVERARLFPTISFNADLSTLFGGGNRIDQLSSFGFGLGPAVNWEGPDLRRVRADIDIADAQTARAYKVYEQTVLQAIASVEAALSDGINERLRQSDLTRAVTSARGALELARLRFDEGVDDFLDVLDAQRTLLDAEDRLAQNELQTTRLAVLTYRELGGID